MGEKGNQDAVTANDLWTVGKPGEGAYWRKHPEEYHNSPVGPKYWVHNDDHGFGIYQDSNGDRWKLTSDAAHPWELDSTLQGRDPHEWASLSPSNAAAWNAEHPEAPYRPDAPSAK
jgi:hypothetical protein